MRIAALSDIHGNLAALEAVLADCARRGADLVVNLGDILSGPLQPFDTAERLMALGLPTIRGNHERQLLGDPARMGASDAYARGVLAQRHLDWIAALPATLRPVDGVLMVHGTPSTDLVYLLETLEGEALRAATDGEIATRAEGADAAAILCGHSHVPRVRRLADGRLFVNPGSVGLQAYTSDEPSWHGAAAGTPHARYAMLEQDGDEWSAELLSVAYDWNAASALAARNGRADWAQWLLTGSFN